jgi:hypothetical protein
LRALAHARIAPFLGASPGHEDVLDVLVGVPLLAVFALREVAVAVVIAVEIVIMREGILAIQLATTNFAGCEVFVVTRLTVDPSPLGEVGAVLVQTSTATLATLVPPRADVAGFLHGVNTMPIGDDEHAVISRCIASV